MKYIKPLLVFLSSLVCFVLIGGFIILPAIINMARREPVYHDYYLFKQHKDKIVMLIKRFEGNTGGGTGFAVEAPSGKNYVLTNRHVCQIADGAPRITAVVPGITREVDLNIIEISKESDLCILSGLNDREGLKLAKKTYDEEVITSLGHPSLRGITLSQGYLGKVTKHEVLDNQSKKEECNGKNMEWIEVQGFFGKVEGCLIKALGVETSLIVYPGSSGSPVLNSDGEVVGVIFLGNPRNNYGIAVPLIEVQEFLSIY